MNGTWNRDKTAIGIKLVCSYRVTIINRHIIGAVDEESLSLISSTISFDIVRWKLDDILIVSFAGIDPKRRQSSQTLDSNGAIVKCGNSHLRRWLTMATLVMVMHKQFGGVAEKVEAYYRKKRGSKENGGATHHHLYALIAATNKLVRIIYGRYADKTVAA